MYKYDPIHPQQFQVNVPTWVEPQALYIQLLPDNKGLWFPSSVKGSCLDF